MLNRLKEALVSIWERVYRYSAEPNTPAPYIVWGEDSGLSLEADNIHSERGFRGTVDLYTQTEDDPLTASIPEVFESIGASYYLSSVQFEDETGLIHYEWIFEVV